MKQCLLPLLMIASMTFQATAASPVAVVQEAEIIALQAQIIALKNQIAAINSSSVMALQPFVSVDPNPEVGVPGPNIVFRGANIHIENGLGSSYSINGLGNLIIGYDENTSGTLRNGSHDLVLGEGNNWYNAYCGIVTGFQNTISGRDNSILGGEASQMTAGGTGSVILAGSGNQIITGVGNLILGGENNQSVTGSNLSVIVGGGLNYMQGQISVIGGGSGNREYGNWSILLGEGASYSYQNSVIVRTTPANP